MKVLKSLKKLAVRSAPDDLSRERFFVKGKRKHTPAAENAAKGEGKRERGKTLIAAGLERGELHWTRLLDGDMATVRPPPKCHKPQGHRGWSRLTPPPPILTSQRPTSSLLCHRPAFVKRRSPWTPTPQPIRTPSAVLKSTIYRCSPSALTYLVEQPLDGGVHAA